MLGENRQVAAKDFDIQRRCGFTLPNQLCKRVRGADVLAFRFNTAAVLSAAPGYIVQGQPNDFYMQRIGSFIRGRSTSHLSLIHISEPTRLLSISYAVFCLKKKT